MKMIEVDDGNGNKAEIHRYGAATEEDILFKDYPCGETVIYVALIFNIFLNGKEIAPMNSFRGLATITFSGSRLPMQAHKSQWYILYRRCRNLSLL